MHLKGFIEGNSFLVKYLSKWKRGVKGKGLVRVIAAIPDRRALYLEKAFKRQKAKVERNFLFAPLLF